MSQTVAPLLTEKSVEAAPRRNFARPVAEETGFADTMAAAEKKAAIRPASSWRVDRSAAEVKAVDNDFRWSDALDVINPLQHIPVLGSIYRELTGDTIKPYARVAGDVAFGTLVGGLVLGGVASIANALIEEKTGKDPVTHVADALFGATPDVSPDMPSTPTAIAAVPAKVESLPAVKAAPTQPVQTVAAEPTAKPPFGGVMAPASSSATRTGPTFYASPPLNTAATRTAEPPSSTPVPPSLDGPLAEVARPDSKTLAQLMHHQAKAATSSNQLPADLVRDMMLMALDKYKTAEGRGLGVKNP